MVFKSKKDKFSEMLSNVSKNLKESAQFFVEYKIKNASDLKEFSMKMKEYETKGDTHIHEIIMELNNAFITPIEREDILQLAMSMDDVLDGLEHCAALFEMYSVTEADEYMIKFGEEINACAIEIAESIELMSNKKLLDIRTNAIKIKDHESTCDDIRRHSIKHLFSKEKDPIKIIQYKEIYENLEEIADSCQGVANVLETIIMKNA
jgi:predicted phosphate transport protein (TIGR00153 family)